MTARTITGKTILIAGGAKNLGGLLARDFAAQGAKAIAVIHGMPPLKWSTHRDMLIPFLGGPEDGWQAREARRYRAEAASS